MNNIPDELFHLLESKSWQALEVKDKELVKKYISESEYHSLHEMFKTTQNYFQKSRPIKAPEKIAFNLKKTFKAHHQRGIMIPLWQAAAVFVMMLTSGWYFFKNQKSIEKQIVNTIHDTVFVPQMAALSQKTIDTVVIYKYIQNHSKDLNSQKKLQVSAMLNAASNEEIEINEPQIRTLSREEIEYRIKNIKTKSMLEDTLYQRIGFASI